MPFSKKKYKYNNNTNIDYLFKYLGPIEKKIHVSWKKKDILDLDFNIVKHGSKQLKNLNPDYKFEISDNNDVELYIKSKIPKEDYLLIKDRHIVEKVDLWRLLEIYYEGGVYMDIDRFCNIPLKNIIKPSHKCILPLYYNIDVSQDIMISASNNIIYKTAIDLNLKKRKEGCNDIMEMGPVTYFNAITKLLLGYELGRYPNIENLNKLKDNINNCKYLDTYIERPPFNTITYQGGEINNDKEEFYQFCNEKHWTRSNKCGNSPLCASFN